VRREEQLDICRPNDASIPGLAFIRARAGHVPGARRWSRLGTLGGAPRFTDDLRGGPGAGAAPGAGTFAAKGSAAAENG
jgi:hypothetical protein